MGVDILPLNINGRRKTALAVSYSGKYSIVTNPVYVNYLIDDDD